MPLIAQVPQFKEISYNTKCSEPQLKKQKNDRVSQDSTVSEEQVNKKEEETESMDKKGQTDKQNVIYL